MNTIKWIVGIAIVLACVGIGLAIFWKKHKNPVINPISVPIKQDTQVIKIDDSTKAYSQTFLVAKDKKTIQMLQDSILRFLTSNAKLIPTTVLTYSEIAQYNSKLGVYQDSLSDLIDSLVKLKNQNNEVVYNDIIKNKKFNYRVEDKWFTQNGSFNLTGRISIDSLKVKSEPYVVIGEKGKWYQRKTLTALVGNKNPNIEITGLQSFTYDPDPKWEVSGGPIVLTNIKQTSVGVGVNVKKGIFSASVGYLLPINQK